MLVYIHGAPGSGKTLLCRTIARVIRPALHLEELPSEMDWGILHDLLETLRATLLTVVDVDGREPEDELMVLDLNEPRRVLVVTGQTTSKGSISKDDSTFMHTADVVIQALKWTPDGGSYRFSKNRFGTLDLCSRTDREVANLLAEGLVSSLGLRMAGRLNGDGTLSPKGSKAVRSESGGARAPLAKSKART